MRFTRLVVLTGLTLLAVQSAAAQDEGVSGRVRAGAGGTFIVGLPQGDFGRAVDRAYGAAFNGHYNITANGVLRLRGDVGYMQYGHESRETCFSSTVGCRVELDVVTSNGIAFGSVGPEVVLPLGFMEPYVNAGIGVSYFQTSSNVSGVDESASWAHTTNFDDAVLSFVGGAGLYIPVRISEKVPFAIDLSARYHRNGTVAYLREGDIQDQPDGTIRFTPRRTEADLVTLQLGVSFGIRDRR